MNLTKQAHHYIDEHFADKKIRLAVDATCGNGNDSLFLAKHAERLFCFDIQATAIHNTQKRLQSEKIAAEVLYFQDCHSNLQSYCDKYVSKADIVMFNLGFLPKSADAQIATNAASTIVAIEQAMQCLTEGGIISILCYRGHAGGAEEYQAVQNLLAGIEKSHWHLLEFDSINANASTPILLVLKRKVAA